MTKISTLEPFVHDDKADIIEHINEEHYTELQAFAKYLLDLSDIDQQALISTKLLEIYQQGLELKLDFSERSTKKFLSFPEPIIALEDLNQAYIGLLQSSQKKQGKETIRLIEQKFTVLDSYFVTQHIFRLVLEMPDNAPLTHAGYAYLFNIDPQNADTKTTYRYYTLRKAFVQYDKTIGWVDIFVHDSPSNESNAGAEWAKSLKQGDIITSKREFPEHIEHLQQGQALLIADETSLPTVARLLEVWKNPIPPVVISVTQHKAEQRYLESIENNRIFTQRNRPKIICLSSNANSFHQPLDNIMIQIIDNLLDQNIKIDKVWGGLEANVVKSLRRKLLPILGLIRKEAILKVYWR